MKEVKLRNGSVVPDVAVPAIHLNVEQVMTTDHIAFWELVEVCRKPGHTIFSEVQAEALAKRALLDVVRDADGNIDLTRSKPHQIIRDIVASSIEGELPDIRFVSPYAEDHSPEATP